MKTKATVLSPDFEKLVDHHINQMLINMVDIKVDELAKYKVLMENDLRMLWLNQKDKDQLLYSFHNDLLYPAFIEEEVELSNELTLAGHQCVILRGELTSVFSLPIIKIHDGGELNLLNDNLHNLTEEEFNLVSSPDYELVQLEDDDVDNAEH